jgi:hypothetical protein
VIKNGCSELELEFSLAQIHRVEKILLTNPERLSDYLGDLRNRLADERVARYDVVLLDVRMPGLRFLC